jgi:hypothetical protein
MTNFLGVAAVTASLRRFLQGVVSADVSGATVTTVRPTESGAGLPQTGVNVFLFQVNTNPDLRNLDLPSRRQDGSGLQRPVAALDLHYLFSFYGDQSTLEPQRLLGSVIRTLHSRPVLTRDLIRDTLTDPAFGFLAGADLDSDPELVRFTPLGFGLQELSQLWTGMFQKSEYALSVAYRASVVLVGADERSVPALPVREVRLQVESLRRPVLEAAEGVVTGEPVVVGSTVRLRGQRLRGKLTRVRLAGQETDAVEVVSDSELRLSLTAPDVDPFALRAGVLGVQVLHPFLVGAPPEPRAGMESNVAPLVLRPRLLDIDRGPVTVAGGRASAMLSLSVSPLVGMRQRAFLLLDPAPGSAGSTTRGASFPVPPHNEDSETVDMVVSGLAPGRYLVRLQVDGAESPLSVDNDPQSPGFGRYDGPLVDLTGGGA